MVKTLLLLQMLLLLAGELNECLVFYALFLLVCKLNINIKSGVVFHVGGVLVADPYPRVFLPLQKQQL